MTNGKKPIEAFALSRVPREQRKSWVDMVLVLVLTLILGIQGADLGIPTCAISTSTFGRKGTRLLVSSLFTVSLV